MVSKRRGLLDKTMLLLMVMRLTEPIFQSGRNITADNWSTSLELVRQWENKNLSYVGTIRKNKREVPPTFVFLGYTKN